MIGLARNSVKLIESNDCFIAYANALITEIKTACKELVVAIEHVGSTAIPGLPAKPIIDIAIAVNSFDNIQDIKQSLTEIDLVYRGETVGRAEHLFIEAEGDIRTSHIHLLLLDSDNWRHYLKFRDLLRSDQNLMHQYTKLKVDLAERYKDNRSAYTDGKSEFIQSVLNAR